MRVYKGRAPKPDVCTLNAAGKPSLVVTGSSARQLHSLLFAESLRHAHNFALFVNNDTFY
jgi:hypothetical protein